MSVVVALCDQVGAYLKSQEVNTALQAVYARSWTVRADFDVTTDAAELFDLEVALVPGEIVRNKPGRVVLEADFELGILLRKRIELPEVRELATFGEMLFRELEAFVPSVTEGCRGVELSEITSTTLFSNASMEGFRTFESLIVLRFKIFYRKGK